MKNKFKILYIIFLLLPVAASAQTTDKPGMASISYAYVFLTGLLFLLSAMFASFMIFDSLERKAKKAKAKPVDDLGALLIKEHNYDGIFELDNKAPAWFQFLFYVTILFSVIYMVNFHVLKKDNLMIDEYNQEMTSAQQEKETLMKSGGLINETNVTVLDSPEDLKAGKEIYAVNCVSCHGNLGEGTVGPNLTDDYWIHGGGIKNVFATISNGVPAKGMITWKAQLNPKQIQQTASYVLTLYGTKPPNGKPPEGQIYKEESVKPDSTKTGKTDRLKGK